VHAENARVNAPLDTFCFYLLGILERKAAAGKERKKKKKMKFKKVLKQSLIF